MFKFLNKSSLVLGKWGQTAPFRSKWNTRVMHSGGGKSMRLLEVGQLMEPLMYESYMSGQFFLHRVFGYRGVILFSWVGDVFDRDNGIQISRSQWEEEGSKIQKIRELQPERHIFYQTLVDQRDYKMMKITPSLTLRGKKQQLNSITGMDIVDHEDILPYIPTSDDTVEHELFPQFFKTSKGETVLYQGTDLLSGFEKSLIPMLESAPSHRETTHNIRVTIMPLYLGPQPKDLPDTEQSTHVWTYLVRIENRSGTVVQLRHRYWRIYSNNNLETVPGEGVVGNQPFLTVSQPAFQYSSFVTLQSSGHMWGTYRMGRKDGKHFDVRIPPFCLDSHKE